MSEHTETTSLATLVDRLEDRHGLERLERIDELARDIAELQD